jgi:hypothetical protein
MLAVQIGTARPDWPAAVAELRRHGDVAVTELAAGADKSTMDDALSTVDGRRLVVFGSLTGLGAVLVRLLRRDRLADLEVATIVDSPQWTHLAGLPRSAVAAARVAATGVATSRGLVRDDQGGIVLTGAVLRPDRQRRFGVRAYVDDTLLVDARVRELAVRPRTAGVRGVAALGWGRRRVAEGRAVTLSSEPARVRVDGVELANPRRRATFWYDPDCWRLVRADPGRR